METVIEMLFHDYLSDQTVAKGDDYIALSKEALEKERRLTAQLSDDQMRLLEEWLEMVSQIHFLEVKDAFANGCQRGAKASKELII